ncbi:MAG: hypothetical protein WD607_03565 [Candidatus Paceibacterota bacterium]
MSTISGIDFTVIVIYLVAILGVGLWIVRKKKMNAEEYFLAGHSLKWPAIGAALFASNISTVHLVGLAASGYNDGLVWGNFEWMAVFVLIILALVFSPFYFKNKISTLPEFLEKRYGRFARMCLACLGILGALFIHIGVSLYAGAVVFENLFGINIYVSILLISGVTAIYTVIGGLQSVVITETIQTVILIAGSLILTILGISFMMQAWWLFVACSVIYVATSLLTPAPDYEKIKNYTLASPGAFLKDYKEEGNKGPLALSIILIIIMVILYGVFS